MGNRLPTPGGDNGTWGTILNDFLNVSHNSDGTLQTTALQQAGAVLAGNATDSYSSTVTFDLSQGPTHILTLAGNPTLAVTNDSSDPRFTIVLNTGAGSFTVTWWSGIRWAAGLAPTITSTASKYDVFTFIRVAAGTYLGFVVGQGL